MKLCLIGSRGHYKYALDDLSNLKDIKLVGVSSGCDDSISKLLKDLASIGFSPRTYDDYRQMLDKEKPDVVSIDGPFEKHAEMCIESIKRNIHIFCEKPIALSLNDLERIKKYYSNYKHLSVCSMTGLRYCNNFLALWETLKTKQIGRVRLINTQKSYKLGKRPDFYKKKESYGGTIPWVGSHAIDWILWYSQSGIDSVYATQRNFKEEFVGEMEMIAQCQFNMKNGIIANATIDYLRPEGSITWGDDRVRIVGDKGILEARNGNAFLLNDKGFNKIYCKYPRTVFKDFIEDIQGKTEGLNNTEQTFQLTEACLIARESAEKDKVMYFKS